MNFVIMDDDDEFDQNLLARLDHLGSILDDQVTRSKELCDQYLGPQEPEQTGEVEETFEDIVNNFKDVVQNFGQRIQQINAEPQGQQFYSAPAEQVDHRRWVEHRTCWRCGEVGLIDNRILNFLRCIYSQRMITTSETKGTNV